MPETLEEKVTMSREGAVEHQPITEATLEPGMTLWQLTNSEEISIHAYFDICPWNDDGSKIVFCGYDSAKTKTNAYWMDAKDGDIHQIGTTSKVSSHNGLLQQWVPGTSKIAFNCEDDGEEFIKIVDVNTGETTEIKGNMRMAHPNGKSFVDHTFHGFRTSNPHRDTEGVFVIDIKSGSRKLLVSLQDALDIHPDKEKIEHTPLYIKHTKWSPDGSKLFFVFTNRVLYKGEAKVKDIYVVNADGSDLRPVLLGTNMTHPSWHPDSNRILIARLNGRTENKLSYIDTTTGRLEDLDASSNVTGATHPSVSPDGKYIITNMTKQKGDGRQYCELSLFDTQREKLRRVLEFPAKDHVDQGISEHPVWSRDSRCILFNSELTSHGEMYLLRLN